jgi:succinyl-diaminopimelate desuccinylase
MNINFDNGSEFFDKTNLEITSFDVGNDVVNIIPEKVILKFNVRFNDLHSAKTIFSIVLEKIAIYEVIFDLKYESSAESFIQKYSEKMKIFANIVENECRIIPEISTSGGTSDARFIRKYSEVVEFGLNFDQAHKINEYTKISDLQRLYNVYYTSLVEFLKNS